MRTVVDDGLGEGEADVACREGCDDVMGGFEVAAV